MTIDNNNRSTRVLMVDDDANLLEGYRRVLQSHFELQTAQGGEAALAILESSEPFAAIVSDIKMPFMSGIDLLAKVKVAYPDTVRLVLTGYADLETAINVVNSGDIFRFLTKPCETNDLVRAINAALEQYHLTQVARELAVVRRMKDGFEGTLRAFTRLVEFRDPYTAGHMDRTAEIATLIAERLGFSSDSVQALSMASLVHDIGKIAVPAGILNKPGKLSDAEFALIKAHPLVGSEIFMTLDTDWPISRLIVEHHERMDGSGYPHGLYEDQLLPESKVLQVADIIDAIMSNRPYRQMLGAETAIDILNKSRGRKLDSACCDAGIEILKSGDVLGDIFV